MNTTPFAFTFTPQFADILHNQNISLILTTYQSAKVIILSAHPDDNEKIIQLPRNFSKPMGIAISDNADMLAVACKDELIYLSNRNNLAGSYPKQQGVYSDLYIPNSVHFTGELDIHDMAFTNEGLLAVNTLFSCLCKFDKEHNFIPVWKPPFISKLLPEDRCHLNGLATEAGTPKYLTALGKTNSALSWKKNMFTSGILMDYETGEIITEGLSMPHSPRIIDGELYILLSATGEILRVDRKNGNTEVLNKVKGFVRGMSAYGDYLFVSSSHLRKNHLFGELALSNKELICGISVFHRKTGALAASLSYVNSCEEIYDVGVLPGKKRPGILGTINDAYKNALSFPENAFWIMNKET